MPKAHPEDFASPLQSGLRFGVMSQVSPDVGSAFGCSSATDQVIPYVQMSVNVPVINCLSYHVQQRRNMQETYCKCHCKLSGRHEGKDADDKQRFMASFFQFLPHHAVCSSIDTFPSETNAIELLIRGSRIGPVAPRTS